MATQGIFSSPDGNITVDGYESMIQWTWYNLCFFRFYYQAYTRSNVGGSEKLTPDGLPQWCVRFSPRNAGSFDMTFIITNSSGTFTLKTDTFEATDVNEIFTCIIIINTALVTAPLCFKIPCPNI